MTKDGTNIAPVRAVGYVRCSTDEQGSTSIPQQKEQIMNWAMEHNHQIIDWFVDEGKSGTDFLKRPAFARLKAAVEGEPDFKVVLVYDESRWSRALNPRESNYWKMHFEHRGVKVKIINSSSRQGDDIGSCVIELVESAEATEYSKKLSRSVRRGMKSSQQGIYSRGGTAPYGYKRVAIDLQTGERKELRPGARNTPKLEKVVFDLGDQIEVVTVKRIFDWKASGDGYVTIADRLNREQIPPPRRGQWKNKSRKWCGTTVRGIVRNKTYAGYRMYNRLSFSKFVAQEKGIEDLKYAGDRPKMINSQDEWIVRPNAHPAIISEEQFQKANAHALQGAPYKIRPNQHVYRSEYLLSGLIRCSKCHSTYQGSTHRKTGNGYYLDGGYINRGKSFCAYHSIKKEPLEQFVIASLKEQLLSPRMIEEIEEKVGEMASGKVDTARLRLEEIEAVLSGTREKIRNLLCLAEKGLGTESIGGRIEELERTKVGFERERADLLINKSANATQDKAEVKRLVRAFLETFEDRFKAADIYQKKELIRMLVEQIVVDKEQGVVRCYIKQVPPIGGTEGLSKHQIHVQSVAPTGIEPVFEP